MSTIFISGNVMSRGLTLEGLTTTLFLRRSDSPYADTQMQMQRWFGYRGPYLELCRLFASREQLEYFANFHDADEALRQQVIIEHGADRRASAQHRRSCRAPAIWLPERSPTYERNLCVRGQAPSSASSIRGGRPDPNAELVASTFAGAPIVRGSREWRGPAGAGSLTTH